MRQMENFGNMDVCFDMETGDPDDVISLLILMAHTRVTLRSVTIYPGGKDQIAFVRRLIEIVQSKLEEASRHPIKIGGYTDWTNKEQIKKYLSAGISKMFPEIPSGLEDPGDGPGFQVLYDTIRSYPECTIITGGPLSNIAAVIKHYPELRIARLVAQGGFAGDNVVAPEKRLKKFDGKTEMATWNLGGDIQAAKTVIASENIERRTFVSKNVCHGVTYTETLHSKLATTQDSHPALQILYQMMDKYKVRHPNKALHDPLAVCVALNASIVQTLEVELYHEAKGNAWGSRPASTNTKTFISTSFEDEELFHDSFCCKM